MPANNKSDLQAQFGKVLLSLYREQKLLSDKSIKINSTQHFLIVPIETKSFFEINPFLILLCLCRLAFLIVLM